MAPRLVELREANATPAESARLRLENHELMGALGAASALVELAQTRLGACRSMREMTAVADAHAKQ